MSSKFSSKRATSDSEVYNASHGTPVYLYSQIANMDPAYLPTLLGGPKNSMIILVQDPRDPNIGHWTAVVYNINKDEYYFFSSYGGRPDEEKNCYMNERERLLSGQSSNFISDGLKRLFLQGKKVHYSEFPYQKVNDGTSTCGIWAVAFIMSGMNPTEFHRYIISRHITPEKLWYKYFV